MSRGGSVVPFAVLVLSSVVAASDERSVVGPEGERSSPTADDTGMLVMFSWGDVNGDGRLELAAVTGEGTLQLLRSSNGLFEDVTEAVGLAGIENAALALWGDYDGDSRLDLFVGAREGASRLFRNEGDFVDMGAAAGLAVNGAVRSAQWFDHDGDGRLDLFIVTAEGSRLFRGVEGGFLERAELPLGGATRSLGEDGARSSVAMPPESPTTGASDAAIGKDANRSATSALPTRDAGPQGGSIALGSPSVGSATPISGLPTGCASSIRDQANPGTCLTASTTPTLGRLYPLSSNLFVAIGGNVGVGTTSPSAKLHVAGTARITDTLTLAPGGDQALDVTSGSIYKGGVLFIHTRGGLGNTATGREAMAGVTTGNYNTATGIRALRMNTAGDRNNAIGTQSLYSNTIGSRNDANGYRALFANTTGNYNIAAGCRTLYSNTTGDQNTASGYMALFANTTGSRNIAFGRYAGFTLTTGNDNIAIGNIGVAGEGNTTRIGTMGAHTRAFIAGIRGVTTGNANAIPVLVDSAGQLGTVSSSRRFKKDIADMADQTERLLELRPVVFHYRQQQVLPNGAEVPLEYGLIAEEVAEIFPDLVVYDEQGKPFTVKYHLLSSMLLNELKKQHERIEVQSSEHQRGLRELEELRTRLTALERRTAAVPENE